jgi:IS1 family transposase
MKMSKIRIYAIGGLGNQLFAYAFAQTLSEFSQIKIEISDRFIAFGSNPDRKLHLDKFAANNYQIKFLNYSKTINNLIKKSMLFRRFAWKIFHLKKFYSEKDLLENRVKSSKKISFRDYFQNWIYAESVGHKHFLEMMSKQPKSQLLKQMKSEMEQSQPIAIHLRLGDYLDLPNIYDLVPQKYFLEAIERIQKNENKEIWIFCENINEIEIYYPFVKQLASKIIDKSFGISDLETFYLLSDSKFLVTTNSTFSMWAGWIASNNNAVVYSYKAGDSGHISNYHKWFRYEKKTESFEDPTSDNAYRLDLNKVFNFLNA